MLWWEYSDAALVIIECGDLTAPREVLPKLGRRVCTGSGAGLAALPRSIDPADTMQVTSIVKGLVSNSTVTYLTRNDYPEGLLQISIRYPASLPMYGVHYSSLVSRYANGRHAGVLPALR